MIRRKFWVGSLAFLIGMLAGTACGATRLLYWNIQDGMWDGQTDNFNRFVGWVQKQSPDICVFAEVRTKRQTGTTDHVKDESQRILPKGWPELAARYGHQHVWISSESPKCYMQGITSRFPGMGADPGGYERREHRDRPPQLGAVGTRLQDGRGAQGQRGEIRRRPGAARRDRNRSQRVVFHGAGRIEPVLGGCGRLQFPLAGR